MPETRELTLAEAVREAMAEEMRRDARVFICGEDIAEAGTVFKVLAGLVDAAWPRLGAKRLPPHQVPRVQWQRLRRAFHGSALARLARSALNRPV